ncbi:MAG TPA: major facilitator superfamily domain-containing protein 6 [Bacilli bacterium]|nr:major facilitator superfamily domain-containing protein 6 [Bacilli bacterium]
MLPLELHQPAANPAKKTRVLSLYYLLFFSAFGAMAPLLPLFLKEEGLSGTQTGLIVAVGPVMTVLFQPVWGMLCDRFNAQRTVLMITLSLAAVLSALYPLAGGFLLFFLLFAGMSMFHSSGVPIVDSIALNYVHQHGGDYGSLRLWGAIGFAAASWAAGRLAEGVGLSVIFWFYAAAYVLCVLLTPKLPRESNRMGSVDLRKGLKVLLGHPRFLLFCLATFLIFGTIQANNSYYGIFFTEIGGTVAGVGLSFLIAAGSEAPVMRLAGPLVRRFGLLPMLVIAGLISSLRWIFYGTEPSSTLVLSLLFVQGLSVGLYIPAAAQYVREIAPEGIKVTALGIYSAIGNGLGSMAGTMVGGYLLDRAGIFQTYTFFGIASLVGVGAILVLMLMNKKRPSL